MRHVWIFDLTGAGLYRHGFFRVGQPDCTSFGFQVIVQNGSTTAFNQDTAAATDLESTAISYPTAEGGMLDSGVVNPAFPSISQTLDQTQDVTHTDFNQTGELREHKG